MCFSVLVRFLTYFLNFGFMFDLVCDHFGSISASFWLIAFLTYFGTILAPFLRHLGSLGAPIGSLFGDLGPPKPPRLAKVPPRPPQDLNFEPFGCPWGALLLKMPPKVNRNRLKWFYACLVFFTRFCHQFCDPDVIRPYGPPSRGGLPPGL